MVFPEHEMREQIGGVLNIDDGNETMNSMVREIVEMGQGEIRVEDAKGVLNYLKNKYKNPSHQGMMSRMWKQENQKTASPPRPPIVPEEKKKTRKRKPLKLSPMHLAARSGDVDALKQAIESDKSQIDKPGFGNTPLAWAAKSGSLECVRILLDAGAKIREDDSKKSDEDDEFDASAPLHYATSRGLQEIVELLVKRGANVKSRDTVLGGTLLHAAVTSKFASKMVPFVLNLDSSLLNCTFFVSLFERDIPVPPSILILTHT